jgi:hypothetical protein
MPGLKWPCPGALGQPLHVEKKQTLGASALRFDRWLTIWTRANRALLGSRDFLFARTAAAARNRLLWSYACNHLLSTPPFPVLTLYTSLFIDPREH